MGQGTRIAARDKDTAPPSQDAALVPVADSHLTEIVEALQATRNGYVQIIVQDGRIIQIDRMEKRRLR